MAMSKKVLLLGGSGLLSSAALCAFVKSGCEVTAITRGRRPLPGFKNLKVIKADRKDFQSLSKALENSEFDFTADFLAYDEEDINNLFSVKNFFTRRYCMISSGQVYLVSENQKPPFKEEDSQKPAIPEPAAGTRDWHNWVYGMGKRRAEAALEKKSLEKKFDSLALRLPVVQGERDWENSKRLWAWLERIKDGRPVILPDGGENIVRFIYAGDAALFLEKTAFGKWPSEKALNLAQKEETTLKDFISMTASIAGYHTKFVSVRAEDLIEAGIPDFCYPYWGKWCSRPDPERAISIYSAETRSPAEYLLSVIKEHLENNPSSHEGYSFRDKELKLIS